MLVIIRYTTYLTLEQLLGVSSTRRGRWQDDVRRLWHDLNSLHAVRPAYVHRCLLLPRSGAETDVRSQLESGLLFGRLVCVIAPLSSSRQLGQVLLILHHDSLVARRAEYLARPVSLEFADSLLLVALSALLLGGATSSSTRVGPRAIRPRVTNRQSSLDVRVQRQLRDLQLFYTALSGALRAKRRLLTNHLLTALDQAICTHTDVRS